ncbi:MAG: hypothetical protein WA030_03710 [Candidatus Microsaccharimonas sp.]
MKKSITQEFDYGCGVACFAFVTGLTYKQAVEVLGRGQTVTHGWRPSDLTKALNDYGLSYRNNYVRKLNADSDYLDGTIILIERSEEYKVGHYLVQYKGKWMDPWVNMPQDGVLAHAKSGFREQLPGKAMYAIIPLTS